LKPRAVGASASATKKAAIGRVKRRTCQELAPQGPVPAFNF
jgi:hypothetical protein